MQRQTKDQIPASRLEPGYLSSSILRKASPYPRALALLFPLSLFLSQKTNPAAKCFQESSEVRHLREKTDFPALQFRCHSAAQSKPWDSHAALPPKTGPWEPQEQLLPLGLSQFP